MELKTLLKTAVVGTVILTTGCVDDNYDLSDIDTTVQVNVDRLVIPIEVDEISMKSIFDLDPDGSIKIIDDVYTYVKDGTFSSSDIKIDPVTMHPADISRISLTQSLPSVTGSLPIAFDIPLSLNFGDEGVTHYEFAAHNITSDIQGLTRVEAPIQAVLLFKINGLDNAISKVSFNKFKFQLPTGLEIEEEDGLSYDSATGVLTLSRADQSLTFKININATALNLAPDAFDAVNHSINFRGNVGLLGGDLTFTTKPNATVPESFGITLDVTFSKDINIKSFDGTLQYKIDSFNVPDIDITNLPDILNKPGTNLVLTNPCIYVKFNNPLSICNVYGEAGLSITAFRGDKENTYTINDGTFRIAPNDLDYFCFSPSQPTHPNADYPNALHVPYTSLQNVLAGDGLPTKLRVSITDPQLPLQQVKGLLIGHNYGAIKGNYDLEAPLQLQSGSKIIYTDRIDGWNKDIKEVTVTNLEVTLDVTTDIPVGLELTAKPIGVNGNYISGVTVECTKINPNASGQTVTIKVNGTVKDLDGIEFEATATAADGNALNSNMHIILKNIRPCVSGYYSKEL